MSKYDLVHKVRAALPRGEVLGERTIYDFLAGKHEMKSKALGHVLDALGLELRPKPEFRA